MSRSAFAPQKWHPKVVDELLEEPLHTSMGTAKVRTGKDTGYLKAMGNPEGPHALAKEYVGSCLAEWFGLRVPDFAIVELDEVLCYDLPKRCRTTPGPAFLSRFVPGATWKASADELDDLVDPSAVTRIVVFDTWVRNCDRHFGERINHGNVYLARAKPEVAPELYAIDHTHCFDCGRELTGRVARIDIVRDEGTYGLFPEFSPLLDGYELDQCQRRLKELDAAAVKGLVSEIPKEWEVADAARKALGELIVNRAGWLADRIEQGWTP